MGLYKRGKKWWCSIVDPQGQLIRRPLGDNKRTAETIFADMRRRFELQKAGVLPQNLPAQSTPPNKDVQKLLREFLNEARAMGRSPSYFERFGYLNRSIILAHGITNPNQITPQLIKDWVQKKMIDELVAGQTVNNAICIFHTFLKWLVKNGHTTTDAMADWKRLKEREKKYRRDLTSPEVSAIINTEKVDEFRLRWLVYFYTGLRKTAGENLNWSWVDWGDKLIVIPVEFNKSKRTHRIPIHPDLYEALLVQHEKTEKPKDGPVFQSLEKGCLLLRLKRLCKEAGIDLRGVCLHSIRHTVASRIYEASDKNLKAVQEVLGHANISTTAMYLHVTDEVKRSAVESLRY